MEKSKNQGLYGNKNPAKGSNKGKEQELCFGNKVKFPLWCYPETMSEVENLFKENGCNSRSEFIEKAIKFYVGYLHSNKSIDYISPFIASIMESSVAGTEHRLSRLLFKVAVELGKLSNITAAANGIDSDTLKQLHGMCINEVKKINGIIDYESAVKFQKE